MTKASRWGAAAGLAALCGVAGCDWQSGGSADTTSNRYNWVNFSGVYRASSGGVLISDYTSSATSGAVTNTASETIGRTTATRGVYSGTLSRTPVLAGSVRITVASVVVTDDGSGALAGGTVTGTIIYSTGAWSLDLSSVDRANESDIRAIYQYEVAGTPPAAGAASGVSGRTIYTFTVVQNGNSLTITDNNGATYTGKFGSTRTTGGVNRDTPLDTQTPASGDTLIADFNISGTSAAGVSVKMTGTFMSTLAVTTTTTAGGTTTTITMNNRRIDGTWIEPRRTGRISGVATAATATF